MLLTAIIKSLLKDGDASRQIQYLYKIVFAEWHKEFYEENIPTVKFNLTTSFFSAFRDHETEQILSFHSNNENNKK